MSGRGRGVYRGVKTLVSWEAQLTPLVLLHVYLVGCERGGGTEDRRKECNNKMLKHNTSGKNKPLGENVNGINLLNLSCFRFLLHSFFIQ